MIWTPSIPPPHPSTIPPLSPLAQSVLALIRQEGNSGRSGGNSLSETSHGTTVSGSSHDRHWNSVTTGVQQQTGREDLADAVNGLFDFQIPAGMNPLANVAGHHSRSDGNPMFVSNLDTFPSTSHTPANLGLRPLNTLPWTDVRQRDQFSKCISRQTFPSLVQPSGRGNQTQRYHSPFEPVVEIRENNRPRNLSPDMEFDDMEVYSCPFNEPEGENIKMLNRDENPSLKIPVAAANSLNFKEIKPRPLQKGGLQINTPLQFLRPSGDGNRMSTPRKMEPSDQTFVFNNANTVPNFKRTLANFKNTPSGKPNPKKSFVQKIKDDKYIFQGRLENKIPLRGRTFNEDRTERGRQESLDCIRAENFELDDVFGDAFENAGSKVEREDKNVKSMMGNVAQQIETNFNKTRFVNDRSISTNLSKNVMTEIQENTHPQVLTKQLENQIHFSTSDSNLNQQTELSENLFVKTQESVTVDSYDCVQNRVNKVDERNQTTVLYPLHCQQNVMNFASDESTDNQQDMSQNLFVKTQESVIALKRDCPSNRVVEIDEKNLPEDFSLPPYQTPLESNDSPDFDADDLFSLKDESLKGSLAALEGKCGDFENKRSTKYGGEGDGKGLFVSNSRIENFNVAATNSMKSEEKIELNGNNSLIDKMKQKTDGKLPVNKNIKSKNSYNVLPVKSMYFQASNQRGNSMSEFQSVSMNGNSIKKENRYRIGNVESPGQVKGKVTTISVDTGGVGIDGKQMMEVDIEIERGNVVTKYPSKNTALKQSTLFDCRKFQPEVTNSQDVHNSGPTQSAEESVQVGKFKKPLPPVKKPKMLKAKVNRVKKADKSASAINLDDQSRPEINSDGKEFLQSNTPMQEIKQKCDPSKLVQTSLVKNEPAKRSASLATKPKKSKKACFVPPIAASHLTSQETELKNYTITVIDEVSANEVLQRLNSEELIKVVTTVTFKEGYTLLNKPEDQKKNSRCFPSGVMFMIVWAGGRSGYYWLPMLDHSAITAPVITLVDTLMSKSERNICFEAQAVYMLLMDILKIKEISQWNAYDPLIGSWLLDPDNPPRDFQETSVKLDMDKNLLLVNPQANTKNQACELLAVLDVAMNILQNRLVNASLWTVFSDMETKLIPILAVMESCSILVDVEKLHRTAEAMDRTLRQLQSEAHTLADRWFQLNSPQQLREILFDTLKLDEKFNLKIRKTEHGVKSTSESVLEQMKDLHPLPRIVLEYRHLHKLKSTYVDGLIHHVKSDGTIGTSWEQVSAATGRITSKNPNLQAFPKCPINVQNGVTIHMREMFKAREGCTFLAADFQQIEFRVFAHFTQDKSLLQAFRDGGDIFQTLAERWLGGKGEEEREKTKRIVYSVMYGVGANKLSEYLHVEPNDAHKIIDNFVAKFPSLRSLPRTVIAQCRAQGYLAALSGRRRLFPHICSINGKLRSYSERQAMNFLIQGSAADICKAAMLDCEDELRSRGLRAKLLLMIHDELVWEVDDRDLHETAKTVREAMERRWNDRLKLLVNIPVCVSTGKTLADMQTLEDETPPLTSSTR